MSLWKIKKLMAFTTYACLRLPCSPLPWCSLNCSILVLFLELFRIFLGIENFKHIIVSTEWNLHYSIQDSRGNLGRVETFGLASILNVFWMECGGTDSFFITLFEVFRKKCNSSVCNSKSSDMPTFLQKIMSSLVIKFICCLYIM